MTRFQAAIRHPRQQKEKRQDAVALTKRDYTITTDGAVATPSAGVVSHYRTADGWRQKDDTGTASDVGGGGGGDSLVLKAVVPISSAAILDLHNTPFELVEAPGAGVGIVPLVVVLDVPAHGSPYSASGGLRILWGDDPEVDNTLKTWTATDVLRADGAAVRSALTGVDWSDLMAVADLNKPLTLSADNAITGGDGTLTATIVYVVV